MRGRWASYELIAHSPARPSAAAHASDLRFSNTALEAAFQREHNISCAVDDFRMVRDGAGEDREERWLVVVLRTVMTAVHLP